MSEPWRLKSEQRKLLKEQFGFDDARLDEIEQDQREAYEADVQEDRDAEDERYKRFGLKHECTCTEDVANGKLAVVPHCTVRLLSDLFDALENVNIERDLLKAGVEEKDATIQTLNAEIRFLKGD